jgi:hypothetical protein
MEWALANDAIFNLAGFQTTRYISTALDTAVDFFETGIGVSFGSHFCHAFVVALTRALQEADTRQQALDLLRVCITKGKVRPALAVHFALPFLAFANEDLGWLLAAVGGSFSTISSFLYHNFHPALIDDEPLIVGYLSHMFGDRHTAHRFGALADCIAYGVAHHPNAFATARARILARCRVMLDAPGNVEKWEVVAAIAGKLLSSPEGTTTPNRDPGRPPDEAIARYVGTALDAVGLLMHLDFTKIQPVV